MTIEPTAETVLGAAPTPGGRSENFYRKWRPRSFEELAGQDHVSRTLTNALANNRVAHAYLFCGPRGTGKTSTGRLFAKALNCTDKRGGEPCNLCESCTSFLAGRAMDLIELDAASNRGIDEIRGLRDKVAFAPGAGQYKVYLIDEVHMLTDAAFNALLKTLEEPPPHAVFILATTDAQKVPATIISRCQRFDFRRIPLAAALHRLQTVCEGEGIECDPDALELIARSATGSLRDSENLLDQLATSYGGHLTIEHVRAGLGLIGDERAENLARLVLAGDLGGGLSLIATVRDDGLDLRQFQKELVSELRALLLAKSGLPPEDGATEERRMQLQSTVANVPVSRLLTALRAFGEADLKADPNSTLPLDIALAECLLGAEPQSGARAVGQESPAPVRQAAPVAPPAAVRPATTLSNGNGTPPAARSEPAPANWSAPAPAATPTARPVEPQPPAPRIADTPPAAEPYEPIAPVVRPAATNAAPTPPTLAAARAQMRLIYDEAKAASAQLGALLNSACDIIGADEAEVVFGFKYPLHADRAAAKTNLTVLGDIATRILGRSITVRCVQEDSVESWRQRETASRSPLARFAQEMGATVLSSSEQGPESEA